MEKMPKDFNEVLHGIQIMKQQSMNWMDAIIEYCNENDYRPEDVGYILREHKNFVKILEDDFKRNKYLRGSIEELQDLLEEWN